MNSAAQISERFNVLYDEIDSQLNRLRESDSIFSQFSMQSDDAKLLNRSGKGDVDELIQRAEAFDIEMNDLRRKIVQRKKKSSSMKSTFPPIWHDAKLSSYVESIVDNAFESDDEILQEEEIIEKHDVEKPPEDVPRQIPVVKPILKSTKPQPRRNVATNVKFLIHQPPAKSSQPAKVKLKQVNKKIQAPREIYLKPVSGTIFPCRIERQTDAEIHRASSNKVNSRRPQTAPSKLKFAPLTVTSTAKPKPTPQGQHNDDVVSVIDSNLATVHTENAKQMTTRLLPVISIKGSCAIQKIYQLEISPSNNRHRINSPAGTERGNIKFMEFTHDPPPSAPLTVHKSPQLHTSSITQPTVDKTPNENDDVRGSFINVRDVHKMLDDYGVHLRDGKIHVVVESAAKRRSSKTIKRRKSFKPSKAVETTPLKATDEGKAKINICSIDDAPRKGEMNDERDSSMSSSITDDGKIRQILMINRDGERHRRSAGRHSSSDSYPTSVGNCEISFQAVPPQVDLARSVDENFQSIYKLIESTFEPSVVVPEPTTEIHENEKEIDDGMNEMREIIKMSEENIKRAGMLLKKYQGASEEKLSFDVALPVVVAAVVATEVVKSPEVVVQEPAKLVDSKDYQVEAEKDVTIVEAPSLPKTSDFCAQTSEDKIMQTDGNLDWKSRQFFGSVYEKYSNFNHIKFNQVPSTVTARHNPFCTSRDLCNCVGCEKTRNFPMPTQRFTVEPLPVTSQMSPFESISTSPKLSVPYNPIYSDDDEVMKAAGRFLRSVEKRKNRNPESDVTSSETSSSNSFTPQKLQSRRNSSSISTPSSSALNLHPTPRARNNLNGKLQEAATDIASIQQQLQDIEPFSGEAHSANFSSVSPRFQSPDLQERQELLERYLSEGEVLSQGEIQLGLSGDCEPDDDDF